MMLKTALIGCGRISPMHLASISMLENSELVAVCDVKEERAVNAAEQYNCSYYTDYKKMLLEKKPDVVHICTPHYLHHSMACFAAEQGIHVVLEKPMAINYDDAVDMVHCCEKNHVTLSIMFQNRYNRAVRLIKEELEKENLGKVLSARIIITWNRNDDYYLQSDWKGTWDKEGGGVVIDQAIHSLDLVRFITGKKPLNVQANIYNRRHEKFQVEDCAEGVINFEDDFIVSFYTMNYFTTDAPLEIMLHCEKGVANIIGDEGYIDYVDGRHTSMKLQESDKIDYGNGFKKYWGYCHYVEIKKIYDALLKNDEVEVSGEDCILTQKIVNSIYESGKKGKTIYL